MKRTASNLSLIERVKRLESKTVSSKRNLRESEFNSEASEKYEEDLIKFVIRGLKNNNYKIIAKNWYSTQDYIYEIKVSRDSTIEYRNSEELSVTGDEILKLSIKFDPSMEKGKTQDPRSDSQDIIDKVIEAEKYKFLI